MERWVVARGSVAGDWEPVFETDDPVRAADRCEELEGGADGGEFVAIFDEVYGDGRPMTADMAREEERW